MDHREFTQRIEEALDQIRGHLSSHGGGIEVVSANVETGEVCVRFKGACVGCPLASVTMESIVEDVLSELPEVKSVFAVEAETVNPV